MPMKKPELRACIVAMALTLATAVNARAQTGARENAGEKKMSDGHEMRDSSTILPDGTAYVTRIVPVPKNISPEAQHMLARVESDAPTHQSLEERRKGTDTWQAGVGEVSKKIYPVNVGADS